MFISSDNRCYSYTGYSGTCVAVSSWTTFEIQEATSSYDIKVRRDVALGFGPIPLCYKCVSSKTNPSYHTGAAQTIEWKVDIQQVMNCDLSLVLKTSGLPLKTIELPYVAGVAKY